MTVVDAKLRFGNSGKDGGGDNMLERVVRLEADVVTLKTDIAVIKSNYATKTDVAELKTTMFSIESSLIKWLVGTSLIAVSVASAVVFGITKLVH